MVTTNSWLTLTGLRLGVGALAGLLTGLTLGTATYALGLFSVFAVSAAARITAVVALVLVLPSVALRLKPWQAAVAWPLVDLPWLVAYVARPVVWEQPDYLWSLAKMLPAHVIDFGLAGFLTMLALGRLGLLRACRTEGSGRRRAAGYVRATAGFTLVELLVALAIVGLLTATVLPVFSAARKKANQTACVSNLRQIGAAWMIYVADHDDSPPPALCRVHPRYCADDRVLLCPADAAWPHGWAGQYTRTVVGNPIIPDIPISYRDWYRPTRRTLRWLRSLPGRPAIASCGLHGDLVAPTGGLGSPPIFHGLVLRLALDGSVYAYQFRPTGGLYDAPLTVLTGLPYDTPVPR
ncbi:MAG: type II secretion system protein [Fimbriimonadaceae bacterium]|nr:type II secretion system protein [Fimbriimonadaceae bacterium]